MWRRSIKGTPRALEKFFTLPLLARARRFGTAARGGLATPNLSALEKIDFNFD
jgi:hypothetical protein